MPIIRRKLDPNTVYPEDIRYNPDTDSVESNINGEWVENPAADPRKKTVFPPRITDNSACDAAQTIRDDFKGQIDGILTAIDNSGTAFTIAGIILSLLSFGVFGVFISIALTIADIMLDAGTTALSAALTDAVYDQFQCILYCQFNSSGRLKAGGLSVAESQINSDIGGLAAVVLNSMLSLAGEGGINSLAALGTATGDCSECDPCGPPCGALWSASVGTFLGEFDGYYRFASAVSGTTSILSIITPEISDCCKLLDFRIILNDETVVARSHINCGAERVEGNLSPGWALEICPNFMTSQAAIGDTTPYQVEFLFADC